MSPVLIGLLILSAFAALWWLFLALTPSQRGLMRFVYRLIDTPAKLNGGFPEDDVTQPYAGDETTFPLNKWPTVTVIVPGRNEGHILEKTLGSLCAMDYPNFRVIFVDDQSTDNTAEVCRKLQAQFPHLTVIHNKEAPRDGWIGKTWAVHQAESYMNDNSVDYLLFTDSDLEFHPHCLRQMLRLAKHRNTDITSLLPAMYCLTLGEILGLLSGMCIINSRLNLYACNNPKIPRALVAGGFLLVTRSTYHQLGGHAAVRGQVVEDVAFGTRAKALNKRVFTALTHDLYKARMYEGWLDTFRGLKKNAYAGANYNPLFGGVIALFLLLMGVLPFSYAALGIAWAITAPTLLTLATAATGIAACLAQMLYAYQTARFINFPRAAVLLTAPSFLFYQIIFLGSIFDYYVGGNTWAGRRVQKPQALNTAGNVAPQSTP